MIRTALPFTFSDFLWAMFSSPPWRRCFAILPALGWARQMSRASAGRARQSPASPSDAGLAKMKQPKRPVVGKDSGRDKALVSALGWAARMTVIATPFFFGCEGM